MYTGPHINTKGLIFGFDTGFPIIDRNHKQYKYNLGEPTTTFDVGTMLPPNATTSFTSSNTYQNNLHGTVWDWSYYPNSSPNDAQGMEWVPFFQGPGHFEGAWKMKQRPGGNSESNFSGNAPGAIDHSKTYTVSVWCKTDTANTFRIHINTTRNGSSYWGFASGYHTGGGNWERLSVTIPAGDDNTSINTIRCQGTGNNKTADAYWRNYQVEERGHPTPFILGGSRSVSGSLIDLTGNNDINVSNVTYDSNGHISFDGTDDEIAINFPTVSSDSGSIEVIVQRQSTTTNSFVFAKVGSSTNRYYLRQSGTTTFDAVRGNPLAAASFGSTVQGDYYHLVMTWDPSKVYAYKNGVKENETSYTNPGSDISDAQLGNGPGNNMEMKLPVIKIYNRTLSLAEIKQNYKAYKKRFNL